MLARHSRNLKIQKMHFFVGIAISLLFTLIVAFQGFNLWVWQANIVSRLLSFAGVAHKLFIWSGLASGPTFEMPRNYSPVPVTATVILLIAFTSFVLIMGILRRIPPPIKTVLFVVSILAILILLWQMIISPIPSYTLHWVTIDWSCSGVISLCIITLIYSPCLFTIKGPLWVKVFWLFITIGFSFVWNLVRMSLVTATLYYFGGIVFLLLHYMVGAFIDFVYIVALYSLALSHLSKYEAGGMMKLGY